MRHPGAKGARVNTSTGPIHPTDAAAGPPVPDAAGHARRQNCAGRPSPAPKGRCGKTSPFPPTAQCAPAKGPRRSGAAHNGKCQGLHSRCSAQTGPGAAAGKANGARRPTGRRQCIAPAPTPCAQAPALRPAAGPANLHPARPRRLSQTRLPRWKRQIGLAVFILPYLGAQHKQKAKNGGNTACLRGTVEIFTKRW